MLESIAMQYIDTQAQMTSLVRLPVENVPLRTRKLMPSALLR